MIGIKSTTELRQLSTKLKCGAQLIELYLTKDDFTQNRITGCLQFLRTLNKNIRIMLHCPVMDSRTICITDSNCEEYITQMVAICEKNNECLGFVIHPEHSDDTNTSFDELVECILTYKKNYPLFSKYAYIENVVGIHTKEPQDFFRLLEYTTILNVCFDISHFSAYHSYKELVDVLKKLQENYNVYVHISDHNCLDKKPQPLNIGFGKLDFTELLQHIHFGIVETTSEDETKGVEMINDYAKLCEIQKDITVSQNMQ